MFLKFDEPILVMRKILFTIIVALYIGIISIFSIISAEQLGGVYKDVGIAGDNILHIAIFVLFAFLLRLALNSYAVRRPLLFTAIGGVFVAVILEGIQLLIPTRHAMLLDFGLHVSGVAVYIALDVLIRKIKNQLNI